MDVLMQLEAVLLNINIGVNPTGTWIEYSSYSVKKKTL